LPRPTNVIGRRKIRAIVIQKRPDVQQVVNVQTQSLQFARQMRRTVDVALNDMEIGNAGLTQPLFADAPRDLADIGADQNQRTSVERGPSHRLLFDDGVDMREQRAVATPHVTDAQGLLIERAIEEFDDDFIALLEVIVMRAAATPHVHAAIDEQFAARFINARERRIAEQQRAERLEKRQIGDRHSVRTGDLSRITPLRCKSQSVPHLFQPALKFKQLEDTRKAARTAWYLLRINAIWRLPEEIEDSFARQGDHARTYQHSVQIARRPPVNFGRSGV